VRFVPVSFQQQSFPYFLLAIETETPGDRSNLKFCEDDGEGRELVPYVSEDKKSCYCDCKDEYYVFDKDHGVCKRAFLTLAPNLAGKMSHSPRFHPILVQCDPPCLNGGECIEHVNVTSPNLDEYIYKCRCFSGFNGDNCQTRCFFPVEVVIISCSDGVYVIGSDLNVPSGGNVTIIRDNPDVRVVTINGTFSIGANSSVRKPYEKRSVFYHKVLFR
jgi:hypothetical protein